MNADLGAQEVLNFVDLARRYCEVVEQQSDHRVGDLIRLFRSSLADLYGAAARLPEVEAGEQYVHGVGCSTAQWRSYYESLGSRLGDDRHYRLIFDPLDPADKKPVIGDLADDLVDVYADLKNGLELWDRVGSDFKAEAVWNWRFLWGSHWGRHALEALRAIHEMLHGRDVDAIETVADDV